MTSRLYTSESVTEGHPDKIADQISDAVLDDLLLGDSRSRVACETMVTTGMALVAGEITTETYVEIPEIVRRTLQRIGYDDAAFGIDARTCAVLTTIDRQSPEIAMGVDDGGAGDQGMMFGYATDETAERIPAPLLLAHRMTRGLAELRHDGTLPWLRPDGKAQVTLRYDRDRPVRIETVVVSAQHDDGIPQEEIRGEIRARLIEPILREQEIDFEGYRDHINPTGLFVIGGPHGDTGLTGRKIIVDSYGGIGRHGGGAFSGKDATKVDRSGAYAARWAALNLVASGATRRCEVQLAYAIGVKDPVSIHVDSFGTGVVPDDRIAGALRSIFDFTPLGIIDALGLRSPIFGPTAAYGHFGRSPETRRLADGRTVRLFPWEEANRVDEIRAMLGL